MRAKYLLLVPLALIICSSALTACLAQSSLQVLDQKFQVNEFTANTAQSSAAVTGTLINRGWLPANNVMVKVEFYDVQGNRLGKYADAHDRLQPDEVWNFKVEMKGQDAWKVVRYQLSVSGG
jgi:predicted lipid-binding transport protein (Tim44 family)